jgi:hypothetical protein
MNCGLGIFRSNTLLNHVDFSPQLGVDTWEYNTYAEPTDEDFPPIVMPLDEIHCQISRGKITQTTPPLWMTVTMDRVRTSPSRAEQMSNAFLVSYLAPCIRLRTHD